MLCILPRKDCWREGWGLEQRVSTGIPHIAQDSSFTVGCFTPYLLDVVGCCVIMARAITRPGKSFPGRQKQVRVCLVIPVLIPSSICQPLDKYWAMNVEYEELWHKPKFAAILWLKVQPCLATSPFCCTYVPISSLFLYSAVLSTLCCIGKPERESNPRQQHSLKCLGGRKPHSQGSAQEKSTDTEWWPAAASQHGPTATATPTSPESKQGERAIPLCQMESKATYSGSEEVGKCWVSAVHKWF